MYTAQSEQAERDWIAVGLKDMKLEIDNILCDNSLRADKAVRERLKRLVAQAKPLHKASIELTTI